MRNAECGMRNCNAEVGPGMRPVEPMPALQFRIPHSALHIRWLILAEHTLGPPAESIPGTGCSCSLLPAPCSLYSSCSLLPAPCSLQRDLRHTGRGLAGLAGRADAGIFSPDNVVATAPL